MARKVSAVYNAKKKTAAAIEETGADKLRRERVTALVTKAAEKSQKTVVESLSTLKVQITESLDTIGNQLSTELQTLKEVQEAIGAEKETLKSLHDITAEANALETLLSSQEEEKSAFDRVMDETRARWEEERMEREKGRKRNEEQYLYDLSVRRQKDHDEWTMKRRADDNTFNEEWATKFAELQSREVVIVTKEQEFNDLRAQSRTSKNVFAKKSRLLLPLPRTLSRKT
jgi:high-affinity K+ transport system ATPase subunit B